MNNFVRKNNISPEKGKKILNDFLKSTKSIRKQAIKTAKQNFSGRIKKARGILRLLDKGLGLLEKAATAKILTSPAEKISAGPSGTSSAWVSTKPAK